MNFIDTLKMERDFYGKQVDVYNKLISLIEQNPAITELENLRKTLNDNVEEYNKQRYEQEREAKRRATEPGPRDIGGVSVGDITEQGLLGRNRDQ